MSDVTSHALVMNGTSSNVAPKRKLPTDGVIESLNKSASFLLKSFNNDCPLTTSQMQASYCPSTKGTSGLNLIEVNGRKNSSDEQSVDDGDHDISKSKCQRIETTNDRLKVVGTPLFKYGGKKFDNEEDLNLELLSNFDKVHSNWLQKCQELRLVGDENSKLDNFSYVLILIVQTANR